MQDATLYSIVPVHTSANAIRPSVQACVPWRGMAPWMAGCSGAQGPDQRPGVTAGDWFTVRRLIGVKSVYQICMNPSLDFILDAMGACKERN